MGRNHSRPSSPSGHKRESPQALNRLNEFVWVSRRISDPTEMGLRKFRNLQLLEGNRPDLTAHGVYILQAGCQHQGSLWQPVSVSFCVALKCRG